MVRKMIPETPASLAKILVVDASEDLRLALPQSSNRRPISFEYANGVEGALEHLNGGFDAVIADIATPDLGDVELLRRIRKEHPGTKVIVISSGHNGQVVPGLLRQKAFSIVMRPVIPARLTEVLELALASEDWEDDLELLSGTPQWVQVRVACKLQAAERAAFLFHEVSSEFDPVEIEELATAFREMLLNAIEHGGRSDPEQSIYVNYVWTNVSIVFYIRDPGPGFSIGDLRHAAISNPDGSMEHTEVREQKGIRPGGFGILLAKNYVDELIYSERGNEVILVKHRKHRGENPPVSV